MKLNAIHGIIVFVIILLIIQSIVYVKIETEFVQSEVQQTSAFFLLTLSAIASMFILLIIVAKRKRLDK